MKFMTKLAAPKKRTLFEDLVHLYEETNKTYHDSDKLLKSCLEKKTYEMVPQLNANVEDHMKFRKNLKNILKEHYQTELDIEIERLEKEYKKQQDFSKSAWDMYGSELAGDFNKGEVKVGKKLDLLKGILK